MSGSRVSFLSNGLIMANLKLSGTSASVRELLMIWVIVGKRSSIQSFNKLVGIGSEAQVVDEDDIMMFLTSSSVVNSR